MGASRRPAAVVATLVLVSLGTACSSRAPTSASGPSATAGTSTSAAPEGDAPAPPGTGSAAATSSECSLVSGAYVECVLPPTASSADLGDLYTTASAIDSRLTDNTPILIYAFGGPGGDGHGDFDGVGGAGGTAMTITNIADYTSAYHGTALYYYVGYKGATQSSNNPQGATGGASSIVASEDLTTVGPCITGCNTLNVLLVAGGGGGSGALGLSYNCKAKDGGEGGNASATTSADAWGAGDAGGDAGCSGGHGGAGGDHLVGGSGGDGGGGADSHAGQSGGGGVGGVGGPVHLSGGPSSGTGWVSGTLSTIGASGAGGEGEWRGSGGLVGGGGGGGGGVGGGGGGGGGGTDYSGGSGGGGGSYAVTSAISNDVPVSFSLTSPGVGMGAVVVVFGDPFYRSS
jgi:hypothetical protein